MVDVWSEHVVEPALAPDVAVIAISSRDVNANGAGLESQTPGFYALPAVERLLDTESLLERIERRAGDVSRRSEEHTSELHALMSKSYAVICLEKKKNTTNPHPKR